VVLRLAITLSRLTGVPPAVANATAPYHWDAAGKGVAAALHLFLASDGAAEFDAHVAAVAKNTPKDQAPVSFALHALADASASGGKAVKKDAAPPPSAAAAAPAATPGLTAADIKAIVAEVRSAIAPKGTGGANNSGNNNNRGGNTGNNGNNNRGGNNGNNNRNSNYAGRRHNSSRGDSSRRNERWQDRREDQRDRRDDRRDDYYRGDDRCDDRGGRRYRDERDERR
jgi:hypothetical protein